MIEPMDHAAVTALHTLPRVPRLQGVYDDCIQVIEEAMQVAVPAPLFVETLEPLGARTAELVARTSAVHDPHYLARLNDVLLTGHRDLFTLDGLYLTDLAGQDGLHRRPPEVRPDGKGGLMRPLGTVSPELVDESCALLFFHSDSGDDHARWLLQTLPQLRLLERAGVRPDKLIVQPNIRPYQRETLRLLGWSDRALLVRAPERPIIFRELYVGYVGGGVPPDAPVFDRLRAACPRRPGSPEKLYVARSDARRTRRFLNEDRLIDRVTAMGFTVVTAGASGVAEEVALFQGARVICGPLGAGLANAVFADPGATIVALGDPNHVEPWLPQVAALRGHQHAAVFGLGFDSVEPVFGGTHNNWICDVDQVAQVLARF
jgi:hypothetical protein